MSKHANSTAEATGRDLAVAEDDIGSDGRGDRARPIPRISIQAFCESGDTAEAIQVAADDRRLAKAHVSVHMGGIEAGVAHYQESPTPNLIIIESTLGRTGLIGELDRLAESCDAGTKVIVIGAANDVILYRELLKRGVAEYLIAPVEPMQVMESISNLYNDPNADPVGHIFAFIGAKGGIGSSTVCHNVSWCMSEMLKSSVVIADLDLAFGTAGLDFNQDPVQGIAEALGSPERLDEVLLDRLLTKCSEHLSIFAAPGMLDRDYDLTADSCEIVLDVVRQNVPYVTVDLPHVWTSWSKRILTQADEIVVTATPDLASLRNTKNLIDLLKQARQNDRPPHLVINMHGVPKRPEIPVKDFEAALDIKACAVIEFDAETFGQAANNGQMVEEMSPKAKAVPHFRDVAMSITGRKEHRPEKKSALAPLLERFKLKR
ncbi:MAG: AAA family ATPase [Hyphomicrobiaceae bacterium]|nr:AAA family ATPase [Hyphomicrobiaceae bacterium]